MSAETAKSADKRRVTGPAAGWEVIVEFVIWDSGRLERIVTQSAL
jgi:hypothetical protein